MYLQKDAKQIAWRALDELLSAAYARVREAVQRQDFLSPKEAEMGPNQEWGETLGKYAVCFAGTMRQPILGHPHFPTAPCLQPLYYHYSEE